MTRRQTSVETISVHVPFTIRKYGGRKQLVMPADAPNSDLRPRVDSTLVKALARAFRWKRMLESGEFTTIADLAKREGIAAPYLTRVFRLALLAPDIVETILDGRQPPDLTLEALREQFPMDWNGQRALLRI